MAKNQKGTRVFVNREIRAREVRCIDQDNENLGVMSLRKAIELSEAQGLDLVQVSGGKGIVVCKIMDSGKYKYELSKKNKEQARKMRESAIKVKEIKFRPCTSSNDLATKAKSAQKMLEDGCRIKVVIRFKGREMSHKDVGEERLAEFLDLLGSDILVTDPQMDGRNLTVMVAAGKFKATNEFHELERAS